MYIGDRLMQNMHPPPPTRVVETAAREPIPERMVRLIHRRPHYTKMPGVQLNFSKRHLYIYSGGGLRTRINIRSSFLLSLSLFLYLSFALALLETGSHTNIRVTGGDSSSATGPWTSLWKARPYANSGSCGCARGKKIDAATTLVFSAGGETLGLDSVSFPFLADPSIRASTHHS